MGGLPRFDLGTSMWTAAPIAKEIALRFQLSLQLAIMSTLIAVTLALPLGIAAAVRRGTWVDHLVQILSVAGVATPSFRLGSLLSLVPLPEFPRRAPLAFPPLGVDPKANPLPPLSPALAAGLAPFS